MTPSHASHICPKCKDPRDQEAFKRKNGELAGWCSWCRDAHRSRLIKLRERKETVAVGMALNAVEIIAKAEGYAGHPLATLLALSHIAGAKRALAIRDGKSWRGRKAWGEYYRAKRELASKLPHEFETGPEWEGDCKFCGSRSPAECAAKRALDALLAPQHPVMTMKLPAGYTWRVYGGDPENPTYSPELTKLVNDQLKRDP